MTTKLEIERKFLVKLPLSEEAKQRISDFPVIKISQTYVAPTVPDSIERVRMSTIKVLGATFTHYHHTQKLHVSSGVSEETEVDIDEKRYQRFIEKFADDKKVPIIKDRHLIDWAGKVFELDIFHGENEGLAVLEIELKDINEEIELPPFLNIVREVTDEKAFSNASLATKRV